MSAFRTLSDADLAAKIAFAERIVSEYEGYLGHAGASLIYGPDVERTWQRMVSYYRGRRDALREIQEAAR